jgi:DNA polymerase III alpha subunit (gram-positive type)
MNVTSLDLEMNKPSGKIIQIGAAAYKARTGELIETFMTCVNPNEPIDPYITELTGITDADVKNAPQILEAYRMIEAFHKKHKCFMNPIVWGSGRSNDSLWLYDEAKPFIGGEDNFFGHRVVDAKAVFQSLAMVKNVGVKAGVAKACSKLGLGWNCTYGPPHRALADASNTFRIWFHLVSRLGNQFTLNLGPVESEQGNNSSKVKI